MQCEPSATLFPADNAMSLDFVSNPLATQRDTVEPVLEKFLGAYAARPVPGSGFSQFAGRLIPQSMRPTLRRWATNAVAPWQRRRAARLVGSGPLRLNLGCGSLALPGWVNVDLVGFPVDVAWNLSRKLPFPDNSVDTIFHEHVLEHLPAPVGLEFLRECHRIMKTGAVMRAVLPDASAYIRSYCDPSHTFLNEWRDIDGRGLPPLLGLQEEFYGFGHRTIYDYETLAFFCTAAGFRTVERRLFGESLVQPVPDSEWRIGDSFYADIIK